MAGRWRVLKVNVLSRELADGEALPRTRGVSVSDVVRQALRLAVEDDACERRLVERRPQVVSGSPR